MALFAVIENSHYQGDGDHYGRISSMHRLASCASMAMRFRQWRCRQANPGCHLDLDVIKVNWRNDTHARGKRVTD